MSGKIIVEGLRYPEELAVGKKGKGVIILHQKGGKKTPAEITVIVNDNTYELRIGKNETKVLEFEVLPGNNNIKILHGDELIEQFNIYIKPITPVIDLKLDDEQYIYLDKTTVIHFTINDNGIPYKIADVIVKGEGLEAEATVADKKLLVSLKPLSPNEYYTISIDIKYLDAANNIHEYHGLFNIKSYHSKIGNLEEYRRNVEDEINELIKTVVDKTLGVLDVLEKYYEITVKCRKFEDIIGYDPCSKYGILSDVITTYLENEFNVILNSLDLDTLSKIRESIENACKLKDSPLCRINDRIRKYIEMIKDIKKYLEELRNCKPSITEIIAVLSKIVNVCRTNEVNLSICIKAEEKIEALNEVLEKYMDAITRLKDSFNDKLNSGLITDAHEILEKITSLCELAGHSHKICNSIDELKRSLESIRQLLNNIEIRVDESVPYDWFEASIIVSNNTSLVVNNIYIDASEAKHFFQYSDEIDLTRITMPPIYPESEIQQILLLKPKFYGKIRLPYKVCLGEYCIEKKFTVNVEKPKDAEKQGNISIKSVKEKTESIEFSFQAQEKVEAPPKIVDIDVGGKNSQTENTSISHELTSIIMSLRPRRVTIRRLSFNAYNIDIYKCSGEIDINKTKAVLLCTDSSNVEKVLKIPIDFYKEYITKGSGIRTENDLTVYREYIHMLSTLKHDNIIKYHLIETNAPIIVEEFCPYGDLRSLIGSFLERPLDPRHVILLMIPVVSAVSYLHMQNPPIVHGNISSSNILIDQNLNPKLTDIALYRSGILKPKIPNEIKPPEEYADNYYEKIAPQTDVWQLGTLMYYLLTSKYPYPVFHGKPDYSRSPPPIYLENPGVPRELDEIVRRATSVNMDDRHKNAEILYKDILSLAKEMNWI